MYTLAVIVHVIVCFMMIGAILLQSGKGAEIGAAFGGSSQTVFGSRGPGTFLSKVTVGAAIIFMLTSMGLAILAKERTFSSTVIDLNKKEPAAPVPGMPSVPSGTTATTPPPTAEPATGETTTPAPTTTP